MKRYPIPILKNKNKTIPTIENDIELFDLSDIEFTFLNKRKHAVSERGWYCIKFYEEQKIPINIGLNIFSKGYPSYIATKQFFLNRPSKENELIINIGDEITFTNAAYETNYFHSISKYSLVNITTSKLYTFTLFVENNLPILEAIKTLEEKILNF